jgi:hypothetical protein
MKEKLLNSSTDYITLGIVWNVLYIPVIQSRLDYSDKCFCYKMLFWYFGGEATRNCWHWSLLIEPPISLCRMQWFQRILFGKQWSNSLGNTCIIFTLTLYAQKRCKNYASEKNSKVTTNVILKLTVFLFAFLLLGCSRLSQESIFMGLGRSWSPWSCRTERWDDSTTDKILWHSVTWSQVCPLW